MTDVITTSQIEPILDDFLGVDCPHYEELRKRCAQRIVDLFANSRSPSEWRDISTAPRDGLPVELWHRVWCCPITVQWQICFSDLPWIEKTKTTAWPMEAFSHWRPAPAPPQRNEVKK